MAKKVELVPGKKQATAPTGLDAPLQNWTTLLKYFKEATEQDIWKLLEYEVRHRKRISFSLRIYGRASDLRLKREKKQMLSTLAK